MTKKPPAPSDLADKFMLRMPDGMRDELKAAADKNGRSMNSEIVQRLQASLIAGHMSPNDFLGIIDAQTENADKLAEMLRRIALSVENLGRGNIEVLPDE